MKKLAGERRPHGDTNTLLVRALIAAELKQSRAGISAVAGAFTAIGEHKAASIALARMRTHWPEDEGPIQGHAPTDCSSAGSMEGPQAATASR